MTQLLALLIISAACSGYLFCDKCLKYKYIFPREDGQRFYIRAVTFGFPIVLVALLINEFCFLLPGYTPAPAIFTASKEDGAIFASLFAPIYAWIAALAYNRVIGEKGRIAHFRTAMLADDFDAVLWRSMSSLQPIAVSLENRKVYVGLVADGLEPGHDTKSYLTLLPLLSGHRAADTLQFIISAAYEPVLNLLENLPDEDDNQTPEELEAYYISFPRAKITSLHLFNDRLYDHVSDQYEGQKAT